MAMLFTALMGLSASAQTSPYVPPVVSSSVSTVQTPTYTAAQLQAGSKNPQPTANVITPTAVAVDACGNIYELDNGYFGGPGGNGGNAWVVEVPAGGGSSSQVFVAGNSWGDVQMGQDPTHTHLLVGHSYSTQFYAIPITGCSANTSKVTTTGGVNGALGYYYNPGFAAGDFLGNTYISTNGTCCVTGGNYLLEEPQSGNNGNILLTNTANEEEQMAVDLQQNVYFISGNVVYKLPFEPSTGLWAAAPIPFGSFNTPTGLSVDDSSNLYVADSSTGAIYEIPYESGGLNLKDQYVVSGGINVDVSPAVTNRGDMYYTAAGASTVSELSLGYANFNSVAAGQSATRVVNFQFNEASTVTNIAPPTGDFTLTTPALGTSACTTTTYGPSSKKSCQLTVKFTPTGIGPESSAIVMTYTVGGATQSITGFVEGVGQGAALTIDPGTIAPAFAGVKNPAGIVVDRAGNTYIADAGANAVTEYPAGGGAPIPVTLGATLTPSTFSAPLGVAVDGVGNVFVADTGNNRVVEIPFVGGALSPTQSTVVDSALKNPSSVFANYNGDLYIADTGDNAIVVLPRLASPSTDAGASSFGAPYNIGTGMLNPLAVTVDGAGNIYIADSGNNQILAFPNGAGQEIVAADILNPSALATDASGSLFVVDQGNDDVLRIPTNVTGSGLNADAATEVALGVANPYGLAIDRNATLYVTDQTNGAAYTIARAQVAEDFGDFAVGVSSDPLPLTLESAGNLPLTLSTPYFSESGNAGDFAMTSPTGACASGLTLPVGGTCDISTSFNPTVSGPRTAQIAFNSNAANAPQLTLSGNGESPEATTTTVAVVLTDTTKPLFYGEPISITATVAPSGSGTPTGNVSFVIDGVQFGLLPVIKGVATLPLNSGLPGGPHTLYAVYKGDPNNNGSSSAVQNITVARAPTTAVLVVTTSKGFNNALPPSNPLAQQAYSLRHSNTGSCEIADVYNPVNYVYAYPALTSDTIGFLATVSSPGIGVPSGTLTFYSDGKLINGVPTALNPNPPTSMTALLPSSGGVFTGNMQSDADTLGDGTTLGENNVLVTPHMITVQYSGDQNYLPTTSAAIEEIVTDISPTTPVTLPLQPVGTPPYCLPTSPIQGSRPSDPATFTVQTSSNSVTATSATPGVLNVTINSLSNWGGSIDLSCQGLPKYATCSFNPGQVQVLASTTGNNSLPPTLTVTFTTNVPTYVYTAEQYGIFWFTSLLLGIATFSGRRQLRKIKGGLVAAVIAAALFGAIGLSGCSTSSGSGSVTPAGSYPVMVTFTGGETPKYWANYVGYGKTNVSDIPYQVPITLTVK